MKDGPARADPSNSPRRGSRVDPHRPIEVVCLGQYTADVVVRTVEAFPEKGKALFVDDISLVNGGSACNAAVALGKLGVRTAAIGKVGRDAFGGFLLEALREAGSGNEGRDGDIQRRQG